MSELRWHPLLREWVGVAANRQDRPQLPKSSCPFCPGSGKVPENYDVLLYPNDFPAFSMKYPPFSPETGLYCKTGARGVCDVVIYHPGHNLAPSQLSAEHWLKIIGLWTERTKQLAENPEIAYVYIFENTGVAIGVTMPHPHGQIYSFPYIPPMLQRELDSAAEHLAKEGECLYCRILSEEVKQELRLVAQNDNFVAFVPFWARWPGEVQLYMRRHAAGLGVLSDGEKSDLARIIKIIRMKYDKLFGFAMPLMMLIRQSPVRGDHPQFHFHVEFYPIQRSATKIKYLAGVESGGGTFLNDTVAEDKAAELRNTEPR